jgi:type IV secretory pathway VirB10-like protein
LLIGEPGENNPPEQIVVMATTAFSSSRTKENSMATRRALLLAICLLLLLGCTPNTPEPPPPPPVAKVQPVAQTPVESTNTPPVKDPPATVSPADPDKPTNAPILPTPPKEPVNVDEQIEKLTKDLDRRAAAVALASAGRSAVPALLKALDHVDWQVRAAAVFSLGQIGKDANEAKARLQTIAEKDENGSVRDAAAFALDALENK